MKSVTLTSPRRVTNVVSTISVSADIGPADAFKFCSRSDLPIAVVPGSEQRGEARTRREGRPAQPVDRPIPRDQRCRLAVADQAVVLDRRAVHRVSGSTLVGFLLSFGHISSHRDAIATAQQTQARKPASLYMTVGCKLFNSGNASRRYHKRGVSASSAVNLEWHRSGTLVPSNARTCERDTSEESRQRLRSSLVQRRGHL